ncbi:MAG: exodeoxyribonuclease VII large subunit [Verrucomicrobiota bacterium]
MSKQAKSQWNFGELFSPEQTRRVISVSELTTQVKRLLEKQIGSVWVSGEISNFRLQGSSGHIYFTLKDEGAQLACVLFRQEKVPHRDLMQDGQKVLLQGEITVYEARGQYQMLVRAVELQGVGALQLRFEQLKQKLAAEGLFAAERKRPLPRYPQRIGLVTSPTGAAIRDVLHVIQRRNPGLEIILVPSRVQGDGAAREIAEAIRLLNELNQSGIQNQKSKMDLILVTRGGGSLEDLWAFNEEAVARAIFESELPVVSAVGHEIDFTIADFVADLRAATPSAAAELITEGVFASREFVAGAAEAMSFYARRGLARAQDGFEVTAQRLVRVHPQRWLAEQAQRLDDLHDSLLRCARQGAREQRVTWQNLVARLKLVRPGQALKQHREHLQLSARRLQELGKTQLREVKNRLGALEARLRLLGPEQVLARGYSITTDAVTGEILHDAKEIKAGQRLRTRLKTGEIESRAEK